MKGVAGLLCCALLVGCAGFGSKAASAPPSITWVCDSQATFDWFYTSAAHDRVSLRLGGSQQVYDLVAEPSAGQGTLFSDGVLAFNIRGEEGLVYWVATNDLIGRGCKAP
ncbi:MliC family protein [Pseudomonas typographi]|uniref:Lysozyme inhibitor n=1 Tax=Pseudomonas typographi TaxID=2715964 RepID=A0ABR7YVY6_9PSED|nr:MliC family protein [Pseudomonas typographi]MBD1549897.1 lysozyme inhibitor [Pseudomonas typographi]MBD1585278.1 lysozyme inhibitor [Pseudomonas typographi]MBD1597325.1 lysozyme inhibitor [Pseudomonas typographi]